MTNATRRRTLALTLCLHALALPLAVLAAEGSGSPSCDVAALLPAGVRDVLYVRPFTLERGYHTAWRREHPLVTSGSIVVLSVDPAFAASRAAEEPVLLAGDQTVETYGGAGGVLVGVIPGHVDLSRSLVWFGGPGVPEAMSASAIEESRTRAEAAGIRPLPRERLSIAAAQGGRSLALRDQAALMEQVSALIERFVQPRLH